MHFIELYDRFCYSFMQAMLIPICTSLPKSVNFNGVSVNVINANNVTYARTFLVIPIIFLIQNQYMICAASLLIANDILDRVDGVLAKMEKNTPLGALWGGYIDALFDKFVFIFSAIALISTDPTFSVMRWIELVIIIIIDMVHAGLSTHHYFYVSNNPWILDHKKETRVNMNGKCKQTLEGLLLVLHCVLQGYTNFFISLIIEGVAAMAMFFAIKSILNTISRPRRPRVLVSGCFDLFHPGHALIIKRARKYGDVVVSVVCDESATQWKNQPVMTTSERVAMVEQSGLAVDVVVGNYDVPQEFLEKHKIDLCVHGTDNKCEKLYAWAHEQHMMRFLPYTDGISTSDIVKRIIDRHTEAQTQRATEEPTERSLRSKKVKVVLT